MTQGRFNMKDRIRSSNAQPVHKYLQNSPLKRASHAEDNKTNSAEAGKNLAIWPPETKGVSVTPTPPFRQ